MELHHILVTVLLVVLSHFLFHSFIVGDFWRVGFSQLASRYADVLNVFGRFHFTRVVSLANRKLSEMHKW